MSRHAFRSQPTLQRSGGMSPLSLFGVIGLAVVGLVIGALVTSLQERRANGIQSPSAAELAPTTTPAAPTLPAPPPSLASARPQPAPAMVKRPTTVPARPHALRVAEAPHAQPVVTPTAEKLWEQQREAYEHALAAYDANESAEGYRWARQNHIRLERYCRVAARRTQAFLQGCLAYVRGEPRPASSAD